MKPTKPITVSHFDSHSRSQIMPRNPLLSSKNFGWQGIKFDYYQYDSHELPTHTTEHHVLCSIVNHPVRSERRLDGIYRREKQNSGSIIIVPAQVEHWTAWKSSGRFILFSFTPQVLSKIAPEAIDPDKIELLPIFARPEPDRLIANIGLEIKQQLESDFDGCDFYVEHLKNALFAHLLKNYCTVKHALNNTKEGLPPYKLKRAIDYINDNLDKQIKLDDIAQLVDISQYYFCRLFNDSTGISPYKYVIQQRVAKAKKLIESSKLSLADIAYECGFSSQSQMTQHFRKCVGITPKVYRNKL